MGIVLVLGTFFSALIGGVITVIFSLLCSQPRFENEGDPSSGRRYDHHFTRGAIAVPIVGSVALLYLLRAFGLI